MLHTYSIALESQTRVNYIFGARNGCTEGEAISTAVLTHADGNKSTSKAVWKHTLVRESSAMWT